MIKKAELIWLQPNSERFLIGAIARMADGERLLALQDYLGEHTHLEAAVRLFQMERGEALSQVEAFEYLGELHLVNRSDVRAMGQLIEINDTSGYGFRLRNGPLLGEQQPAMEPNQLEHFTRSIRPFIPGLFHVDFRETPYSKEREHLLDGPDLRHGFEKELNELHRGLAESGLRALVADSKLQETLEKLFWGLKFASLQGHSVLPSDTELVREVLRTRYQMNGDTHVRLGGVISRFQDLKTQIGDKVSVIRLPD